MPSFRFSHPRSRATSNENPGVDRSDETTPEAATPPNGSRGGDAGHPGAENGNTTPDSLLGRRDGGGAASGRAGAGIDLVRGPHGLTPPDPGGLLQPISPVRAPGSRRQRHEEARAAQTAMTPPAEAAPPADERRAENLGPAGSVDPAGDGGASDHDGTSADSTGGTTSDGAREPDLLDWAELKLAPVQGEAEDLAPFEGLPAEPGAFPNTADGTADLGVAADAQSDHQAGDEAAHLPVLLEEESEPDGAAPSPLAVGAPDAGAAVEPGGRAPIAPAPPDPSPFGPEPIATPAAVADRVVTSAPPQPPPAFALPVIAPPGPAAVDRPREPGAATVGATPPASPVTTAPPAATAPPPPPSPRAVPPPADPAPLLAPPPALAPDPPAPRPDESTADSIADDLPYSEDLGVSYPGDRGDDEELYRPGAEHEPGPAPDDHVGGALEAGPDRSDYSEETDEEPVSDGDDNEADIDHDLAYPAASLELRQIAGLTAGIDLELDRAGHEFAEGDQSVAFTITVDDRDRALLVPGAMAVKLDTQPVSEPTLIGWGAIDVGSARFVVRPRRSFPRADEWLAQRDAFDRPEMEIEVPPTLGVLVTAPAEPNRGRRRFGRHRSGGADAPVETLNAESWEFIDRIRAARADLTDRERYLHPDPAELMVRTRSRAPILGIRPPGHPLFAKVGVIVADMPWMPNFDDIRAIPDSLGRYLQPLMSLPSIPIAADLLVGPLGIVGSRAAAAACARHIILSLHALSTADLRVHIAASPERAPVWDWAYDLAVHDEINLDHGFPVVVVDGVENFGRYGLTHPDAIEHRVGVVILTDSIDDLPNYCGSVLQVDRSGSALLTNHLGHVIAGTPVGVADDFARHLADDLNTLYRQRR